MARRLDSSLTKPVMLIVIVSLIAIAIGGGIWISKSPSSSAAPRLAAACVNDTGFLADMVGFTTVDTAFSFLGDDMDAKDWASVRSDGARLVQAASDEKATLLHDVPCKAGERRGRLDFIDSLNDDIKLGHLLETIKLSPNGEVVGGPSSKAIDAAVNGENRAYDAGEAAAHQ